MYAQETSASMIRESNHPAKRRRLGALSSDELTHTLLEQHDLEQDDFWETARLFNVSDDLTQERRPSLSTDSLKRKKHGSSPEYDGERSVFNESDESAVFDDILSGPITLPSPSDRVVNLSLENPFILVDLSDLPEHPRLTSIFEPVVIPTKVVSANGLVKFRLQFNDPNMPQKTKDVLAKQRKIFNDQAKTKIGDVSYLPRDFGRGLNLDPMDERLFKFYIVAFCAGRTLLESSNVWLKGVPAIAEKSDCVKHAMLSAAAGYVLDYAPSQKLKKRANHHHRRAVLLLGQELNKEENYKPGQEEPLLMALSLLNHEDIVNWETRETMKRMPKWYRGDLAVKYLLDKSDPGYFYNHPVNVQSTNNRYVMSHYQMKSLILSDTCAPLAKAVTEEHAFKWLLEGNQKEVRRVTGLAGCSAKILHTFAQVTRLCSELQQNPESVPNEITGKIILERLTTFQQWSDLMPIPFQTSEQLFEASERDLDDNGKVQTASLSVALNAESYVQAAQIYILCRLFRKPRSHPEVQRRLKALIKCTNYVPLDGPLYTAQDSLYGLAMAGLVAIEHEHREIVRGQFAPLEMGPRGNDPPVWRMLEKLWVWLDQSEIEDHADDKPLAERTPWWEEMVDWIMESEGRLSLS